MGQSQSFPRTGSDAFKIHDAGSYDEVAHVYERHVRYLAGPLADHICDLARVRPGHAVLDVATGPGIAARRAAARAGPSGRVLGVDLSEGMIRVASQQPVAPNSGALTFKVMDAEKLSLDPESVDAVISLCAVLHFPNLATAVSEMARVARPGARIVLSYGHVRPIRPAHLAGHLASRVASRLLPVGAPVLRAPAAALEMLSRVSIPEHAESTHAWTLQRPTAAIVRELRRLGLTEIATEWRGHEIVYDDPEAFWEAHTAISTRLRRSLEVAPGERAEELRRVFIARAREVTSRGGSLRYPYGAVFISATRPGLRGPALLH